MAHKRKEAIAPKAWSLQPKRYCKELPFTKFEQKPARHGLSQISPPGSNESAPHPLMDNWASSRWRGSWSIVGGCAAGVEALGDFAAAVAAFDPVLLARMTMLKVWIGPPVQRWPSAEANALPTHMSRPFRFLTAATCLGLPSIFLTKVKKLDVIETKNGLNSLSIWVFTHRSCEYVLFFS